MINAPCGPMGLCPGWLVGKYYDPWPKACLETVHWPLPSPLPQPGRPPFV